MGKILTPFRIIISSLRPFILSRRFVMAAAGAFPRQNAGQITGTVSQ